MFTRKLIKWDDFIILKYAVASSSIVAYAMVYKLFKRWLIKNLKDEKFGTMGHI